MCSGLSTFLARDVVDHGTDTDGPQLLLQLECGDREDLLASVPVVAVDSLVDRRFTATQDPPK
ncbi:hypothetical protein OG941_01765 [Streptomyces sp. NBC_00147]